MRSFMSAVVGALLLSSGLYAAAPPTSTANPQVAYVAPSGKSGSKLVVADEGGSNARTLFTSSTPFRFDLAPRSQGQVAINARDGTLRLLTYTSSSNGVLTAVGPPVGLAPATSGDPMDFSPNGRRIAYSCCNGGGPQKLMVYDLDTQTATEWATVEYVWDVVFFRGGTSIAYVEPQSSGGSTSWNLYEISAPGTTPRLLRSNRADFNIDASRANPDALVLGYHDTVGNAFIGLWQAPVGSETAGQFLIPNLTNRTIAFQGTLNCTDQKLAYMSSTTPSGGQVFFIRNLDTNQDSLFAKSSNMQLQFWPTCS